MPTRILRKSSVKRFEPGSPFVPAEPGRPAQEKREAYCTTKTVNPAEDGGALSGASAGGGSGGGDSPLLKFIPLDEGPPPSSGVASVTPVLRPAENQFAAPELVGWRVTFPEPEAVNRTVKICFEAQEAKPAIPPTPAQPATPGQWKTSQNQGWNSGAQSDARLQGDVVTEFRVGQDTGVAVGLSRVRRSNHYRDIDFCMRFTRGSLVIFESGERVAEGIDYDNTTDVFQIIRKDSVVYYKKNNTIIYTSANKSTGSIIVVSALYNAGDEVI